MPKFPPIRDSIFMMVSLLMVAMGVNIAQHLKNSCYGDDNILNQNKHKKEFYYLFLTNKDFLYRQMLKKLIKFGG